MNPVRGWEVTRAGGKPFLTDDAGWAALYGADEGWTVTPLVAAPPAQTVAEVEKMLGRYADLFGMGAPASVEAMGEADEIEARLLAILSNAETALRDYEQAAREVRARVYEALKP